MGPHFALKINITINSWPDVSAYHRNIYHVTDDDGRDHGSTGDRYPFLNLNNAQMQFTSEKNGQLSPVDYRFNPTLGTKYEVEIYQINRQGTTIFEIYLDDEKVDSDVNSQPTIVEDAMVFLSDNFYEPGDATIEYFYLESYFCESGFSWSDSLMSCRSKCNFSNNHYLTLDKLWNGFNF